MAATNSPKVPLYIPEFKSIQDLYHLIQIAQEAIREVGYNDISISGNINNEQFDGIDSFKNIIRIHGEKNYILLIHGYNSYSDKLVLMVVNTGFITKNFSIACEGSNATKVSQVIEKIESKYKIPQIENKQNQRFENSSSNLSPLEPDSDVEQEDVIGKVDENTITKPFDPNAIDVDIATVNLGSLIEQLENDEIDLQPDFQRASDVWDPVKKSRLIESILLGLPLPSFYFSEDPVTKKLSIIDGLQRICAIRDFILNKEKPLVLEKLQFLKDFNGSTYEKLGRPEVKRIKSLKITTNTLRKTTPSDVKYVIFQRVNTAGEPLTPQEMRHALNQGEASVFIKTLAETPSFVKATNDSVKSKRMQDRDFANRFVAFYKGYDDYNGELDVFLNEKMGDLNKMSVKDRDEIKNSFDKSMKCCFAIFGEDTFRKKNHVDDRKKPISKSVYDTISVNIAWLSDSERAILIQRSDIFKQEMMLLFNNKDFISSISSGTGQKYAVEMRFTKVKEAIRKTLNNDK